MSVMVSGISIATIAPRWTSVFSGWTKLKIPQKENLIYDLEIPNRGVVAECRGWDCRYYDQSSDQYCPICQWFRWSYMYVIGKDMSLDHEILKIKNEQYSEHFYQYHNGHQEDTMEL